MPLGPCPTCGRHRESTAAVCPFCDDDNLVRSDPSRAPPDTVAVYGTNRLMRFSLAAMTVVVLAIFAGLVGLVVWIVRR